MSRLVRRLCNCCRNDLGLAYDSIRDQSGRLSAEIDQLAAAQGAAYRAAYIGARNQGATDAKAHVRAARVLRQVRKALGYTIP